MDTIILIIAIVVVAFVLFAFFWPDKVHVERETIINAAPDAVFAHISDFNKWDAWSPWAKLDPNAKYTMTGSGVGQRMEWESEKRDVGSGSQEIIVLDTPNKMVTKLDFGSMGGGMATFDVKPSGNGTKVVWALDTNMREGVPLHMKPMATIFSFMMDGMLGKQYEQGLADLKTVVEAGHA
ncbi:MAG: polyketide cyclase [Hyphococcus sp.]|nr:MAG: polyketide cyclase [Marinicaulis sp.]